MPSLSIWTLRICWQRKGCKRVGGLALDGGKDGWQEIDCILRMVRGAAG